jgi:(p)ppGpp synthase/HD superfamily hydrolase
LTKTEEKVVALLHDSVEDTPVTLDDLRKSFSEVIVQVVDAMTKQEKIEKFIDYLKRAKANPIEKKLKSPI